MAGELILITGITGFIGIRVLLTTLQAGYRVRGVVRSQSKIEEVEKALSDVPVLIANIDFVIVEDLTVPHVFDQALKDVDYVFHLASPLDKPSDDYLRDNIRPAIDITLNVLSAAAAVSTIKRVVVLSSIAPFWSFSEFVTGKFTKEVFWADDEVIHYDINMQIPHPLMGYAISKALSLEAAEEFIATKKPKYSTVFLMPSLVVGENRIAKSAEESLTSTNGVLIKMLLDRPGNPIVNMAADVRDVADLHVLALDPKVPAGRYLVGTVDTDWRDAFGIVKKHFPEAAEKVFAKTAERVIVKANTDVSKTEKAFNFEFRSWEEQVKGGVADYLRLLEKES